MHAVFVSLFIVAAVFAAASVAKAVAKRQQYALAPASDVVVESHARAAAAIAAARRKRQHTRTHCVSASSGQPLAVEVLEVRSDGYFQLRRRGHRRGLPFVRPASAMFSR